TVTVPGAVEGWFALLDRFGTRSFGDLARWALGYAEGGFALSARGAAAIESTKARFGPSAAAWWSVYASSTPGGVLRQAALARTIRTLSDEGPGAYYGGRIGEAIAAH